MTAAVLHARPEEASMPVARGEAAKLDQLLILRGFAATAPSTFHEAAVAAAGIEGSVGNHFREESLRRRGSDLRKLEYIEQVDRIGKRGIFAITEEGRLALVRSLLTLDEDGYHREPSFDEKSAVLVFCDQFGLAPSVLANVVAAAIRRPLRDQRVGSVVDTARALTQIGAAARSVADGSGA